MFGLAILLLFSCFFSVLHACSLSPELILQPIRACWVHWSVVLWGFYNLNRTTSREKTCKFKFWVEWGFKVLRGIRSKNQKQGEKKNTKTFRKCLAWFCFVLDIFFFFLSFYFFQWLSFPGRPSPLWCLAPWWRWWRGVDGWRSVAEPSLFCPLFLYSWTVNSPLRRFCCGSLHSTLQFAFIPSCTCYCFNIFFE